MQKRRLGRNGPEVSALGLGCMGMSHLYGPADDAESVATIHAALDAGISYLDTGDFYGMGHNEMVVRRALEGRRDKAFIAVKFGAMRDPSGAFIGYDARPIAVKNFLAYTLKRLGTDYVDLYMPARDRPDGADRGHGRRHRRHGQGRLCAPSRPVRGVGRDGPARLRRTSGRGAPDRIRARQPRHRGRDPAGAPRPRRLGHGLWRLEPRPAQRAHQGRGGADAPHDIRRHYPRFAQDNLAANLRLVAALEAVARDLGATPTQLAFAWVLSRGDDIVPLIGARRRDQLEEALAAADTRAERGRSQAHRGGGAGRRRRRRPLRAGRHGPARQREAGGMNGRAPSPRRSAPSWRCSPAWRPHPAAAVEVRDIYKAETIVTGTGAAERLRGFRETLAEVMVKASGDATLLGSERLARVYRSRGGFRQIL